MGRLPRFIVLQSTYDDTYLHYVKEDVEIHGFLQFSGRNVISPYTKFEVEEAKVGNGMVHIRCCYNNKYWVRWNSNFGWIVAGADEPEEDQSKWSCTLFRPYYRHSYNTDARFVHVQLGDYIRQVSDDPSYESCLFTWSSDPSEDGRDVFRVIDWESLVIFPKNVAFKGDNDMFLSAKVIEGYNYLEFSGNDVGDHSVGNQIFTTEDGKVRIKSNKFSKFWRRSPNWIWADSDDTGNGNSDTLFWPVKVSDNRIALKNLGNNYFCKELTADNKTGCMNAASPTICKEAKMEVHELVLSRKIYNVRFHLFDARMYSQSPIVAVTKYESNSTSNEVTSELKFSYTDTRTSTWNSSVTLKLGVETTIETGIPFIAEGKIKIAANFEKLYSWGSTVTSTNTVEIAEKVTIPSKTKVKVSMVATKGKCDVPFSYTQRNTLMDGEHETHDKDDGVYTGVNCFTFHVEVKEEELQE